MKADGRIALYGLYFDTGKADIKPESKDQLAEMAKLLQAQPALRVYIVGHTDNQGDAALNLKLSLDRVNEVKKYLISKGINAPRITTEGFGDTKPVAPNDQEATRALNRRVEFTITKK